MLRLNYHKRTWIKKDTVARLKFRRIELNKLILKSLIAYSVVPEEKIYYRRLLNRFPIKSSISHYRNGCYNSGSGRSVFRLFKMNRHECKSLSSYGLLAGMRKSSF